MKCTATGVLTSVNPRVPPIGISSRTKYVHCPRNIYSFVYPDLRVVLLKACTDGYVSNMPLSIVPGIKYVMQRIEAHLENIHSEEDGEKLCASTPHDFYGRHFDHPDSCANLVSHIVACFVFSYLDSSIMRVRL